MFKKTTKADKKTELEKEVDRIAKEMQDYSPDDEAYTAMLKNRLDIERMISREKNQRKINISPDMVLYVAATVFVTVWVTKHEELEVITTKLFSFLPKGRV
jgi:DNA-binding LytR/AlgR family response regulator